LRYRFFVNTDADYELLKQITQMMVGDPEVISPPQPLDGPAFVLVHSGDWEEQRYGKSYVFSNKAGGAPMRLVSALQAAASIDAPNPTYVIIYRPGPHYAFTAWARVAGFTELPAPPGEVANTRTWKLTLDQHEFPIPVSAKSLIDRMTWLNKGLAVAFRGVSIRQITPQEFAMIVDEARSAGVRTPSDAAYAILSQAGGGPLSLKNIYERARGRGLLEARISQLDLSNAVQRDVERFTDLGNNMWVLAFCRREGTTPFFPPPEARSEHTKPSCAHMVAEMGLIINMAPHFLVLSDKLLAPPIDENDFTPQIHARATPASGAFTFHANCGTRRAVTE
jgi:hypothetical protein